MMRGPIDALPSFLASTSYAAILDGNACPFQKAHDTSLSAFEWLNQRPDQMDYFNNAMKVWAAGMPNVFDELPTLQAKMSEGKENVVAFVDVGGNIGHQCEAALRSFPELKGRIVLQDLPKVIQEAPEQEGVTRMAQDIFEKQQIQGMRYAMPTYAMLTLLT